MPKASNRSSVAAGTTYLDRLVAKATAVFAGLSSAFCAISQLFLLHIMQKRVRDA